LAKDDVIRYSTEQVREEINWNQCKWVPFVVYSRLWWRCHELFSSEWMLVNFLLEVIVISFIYECRLWCWILSCFWFFLCDV